MKILGTTISEITEKIKSNFPDFSLKPEDKWIISKGYVAFDLAIYYNNSLYAIVESKTDISSLNKEKVKQYVNSVECRFGILTDGEKYYLYDLINSKWEKLDIEQIIIKLTPSIKDVAKIGTSQVVKKSIKELLIHNDLGLFVDKIEQDISTKKWRFNNLDIEQDFFKKILNGHKQITEFCRYTSLDSLMKILSGRTYQMCGIVGMNDKSEIDYFDNKYSNIKHSIPERVCNNVFISSGTSLKDDLTMWRLYGDDGKGVCLVFEVKTPTNFYIANVSYEGKRKSHKWVKTIKELLDEGLKLDSLNVWKHFFKPQEYSVEQEIRLVFYENSERTDDTKKWIKTNGSSIVIPVKRFTFPSDKFPLILKTIILGPKISEPQINKSQIEVMVNGSHNVASINVECSSIDNYR